MIQVLDRAFHLLEKIAKSPQPCALGVLAEGLGVQSTTCANILKSLLQAGYIEQVQRGGGYRLGPMALGLALLNRQSGRLERAANPVVQHLAAETGESTLVAVLSGARRLVVAQAEGRQTIRVPLDQVIYDDLPATATGLLLLAYASTHQITWVKKYYASIALEDDSAAPLWTPSLEEIGRTGTVIRRQREVTQIAVTIRQEGDVVATLGSFIPRYRCTSAQEKSILNMLADGASVIERELAKKPC